MFTDPLAGDRVRISAFSPTYLGISLHNSLHSHTVRTLLRPNIFWQCMKLTELTPPLNFAVIDVAVALSRLGTFEKRAKLEEPAAID